MELCATEMIFYETLQPCLIFRNVQNFNIVFCLIEDSLQDHYLNETVYGHRCFSVILQYETYIH